MNLKELREAIDILTPYYDKPDYDHVGAESNEIYLHVTTYPLSHYHIEKMIELGWFQEVADNDDGDFDAEKYDAHAAWVHYT